MSRRSETPESRREGESLSSEEDPLSSSDDEDFTPVAPNPPSLDGAATAETHLPFYPLRPRPSASTGMPTFVPAYAAYGGYVYSSPAWRQRFEEIDRASGAPVRTTPSGVRIPSGVIGTIPTVMPDGTVYEQSYYITPEGPLDDSRSRTGETAPRSTSRGNSNSGTPPRAPRTRRSAASDGFGKKIVYRLDCTHCLSVLCWRGMKAILLADMNVELFSTDIPPEGVQLINNDYQTRNCRCRIRDVACLTCGNPVGYHVTSACAPCLSACNNGHFWMFSVEEVKPSERYHCDAEGKKQLLIWSHLLNSDDESDEDSIKFKNPDHAYERMCR
ncbi:Protein fam72b [Gaertneriomyces sp. JEL0708]|nr:Protein fam72b [Gaertneriomyces sp. JEL0708]